jgi:division/cell wall cluster transcriptional repressor MraZ
MTLGGLLCLLGVVAICKFRDSNQAQAQPPETSAAADKCEKKTAEPPLADPPSSLAPLPTAAPKPALISDCRPAVAEVPAKDAKDNSGIVPLGSEPPPILIPATATTPAAPAPMPSAGASPPAMPLSPPPAPPAVVPPPPPSDGKPLPPIKPPDVKVEPLAPDTPLPSPTASGAVTPARAEVSVPSPVIQVHAVQPLPLLRCPTGPKARDVMPLTGTYPVKLDHTRCLTLPKAILAQLGSCDMVLVSPGSDRCLWLTNQAHLDRLAAKLDRSPARESDVRDFKRLYYAQTVKVAMKDGRVAISDRLAQFAGLGADVVLVGIDDHFEVWDAARWQRYTEAKKATRVED